MDKFSAYKLSIGAVILRFYLMMAVVLAAGFSGNWLIALLALPILVSIMAGVKWNATTPKTKSSKENTTQTDFPGRKLSGVA